MNKRAIHQLVHKYALINAVTNEWIYEGSTYGDCFNMISTLPPGTEYVIVAVMKEGKTKNALLKSRPDTGEREGH